MSFNSSTSGGVESRHAPAQEDRPRVGMALPVTADALSTTGQPCAHRAGVAPGPLTPQRSATVETVPPVKPQGLACPSSTHQATLLELRSVTLTFPMMPPTVNEMYLQPTPEMIRRGVNSKAKWLTNEQKQFRRDVIHLVIAQRAQLRLAGRLRMTLRLYYKNHRRTDITNRIKAVEDALTHAEVYLDDSQIDEARQIRIITDDGTERCVVEIDEIA
jgi:crossover junction endodeoxyribonuclease RusA